MFVLKFIIVMLHSRMILMYFEGGEFLTVHFDKGLFEVVKPIWDILTLFLTLFWSDLGTSSDVIIYMMIILLDWLFELNLEAVKNQNKWIELDKIVARNFPRLSKFCKFLVHPCNWCGGLNEEHSLLVHSRPNLF